MSIDLPYLLPLKTNSALQLINHQEGDDSTEICVHVFLLFLSGSEIIST